MKMQLIVATHPASMEHDTSRNHPESPQRVSAVLAGLNDSSLKIHLISSPEVAQKELERVHDREYVDMIEAFCSMGGGALDMDTIVSAESWEAALRAAGGVIATIEEVEGSQGASGFVVARPPGHHAMRDRAMGFCIFNNVVVATGWLRSRGQRVAIIDWDVHHGNGTESMVGHDSDVLYVSLHQSPFYPFDGDPAAVDRGPAPGTVFNVPLIAGTAGDVYREAWESMVLPAILEFDPDWVLLSAGYDAHHADHLAGLRLVTDDYGWMAGELARVFPVSRTVIVLEGGYDLDALRDSAKATVQGLAGEFEAGPPFRSPDGASEYLDRTRRIASKYFAV
jgi:acetoin utilization deacetylase AcuC-like enzyme